MAQDQAEDKKATVEESKWWIDRGPAKEKQKKEQPSRGLIEQRVYEMLKDYSQDRAVRNVVDINQKLSKEFDGPPGEWRYLSLGVGSYPAGASSRIKEAIKLPPYARGLAIDAGYSVRLLITGEPVGERLLDINFTESPSLDFWINGELIAENLFPTVDDALKKLRGSLGRYLTE